MNEQETKTYLDANFKAIRAETKAMADVLTVELKESRKLNEQQHKEIIDKINSMMVRVEDCETEDKSIHTKINNLKITEAKAKTLWGVIVFGISMIGALIMNFVVKHIK